MDYDLDELPKTKPFFPPNYLCSYYLPQQQENKLGQQQFPSPSTKHFYSAALHCQTSLRSLVCFLPLCSESGPSVFLYSTLCWNHSWTHNHGHLCVKFTCQGSILMLLDSADRNFSLKTLLTCNFGATILFLSWFLAAHPFSVSSLLLLSHSSPSCWPVDTRVPVFPSAFVSVLIS